MFVVYEGRIIISKDVIGRVENVLSVMGRMGVTDGNTPIYDRYYMGGFSTDDLKAMIWASTDCSVQNRKMHTAIASTVSPVRNQFRRRCLSR